MNCPHCKTTKLNLSERQGIEIDYCPDCRGVWLDRGELDKIIERSQQVSRQEPEYQGSPPHERNGSRDYERDGDKYKDRKPYRKKTFLEELFD